MNVKNENFEEINTAFIREVIGNLDKLNTILKAPVCEGSQDEVRIAVHKALYESEQFLLQCSDNNFEFLVRGQHGIAFDQTFINLYIPEHLRTQDNIYTGKLTPSVINHATPIGNNGVPLMWGTARSSELNSISTLNHKGVLDATDELFKNILTANGINVGK